MLAFEKEFVIDCIEVVIVANAGFVELVKSLGMAPGKVTSGLWAICLVLGQLRRGIRDGS
jgi:hypothetical protein